MNETKWTPGPRTIRRARLIAAAPDLYEALEWLLSTYTALHSENDELGRGSLAVLKARTALRKARGEV